MKRTNDNNFVHLTAHKNITFLPFAFYSELLHIKTRPAKKA
jgi:hypothetical protein